MNSRVDKDDSFYRSFDGPSLVSHDSSTHQNITADPAARAAQEEEWRTDLAKLESEITTLTSVLNAKQRQAAELKRRLGLTPLQELRRDLEHGVQNIKQSDVYKNTNEKLVQISDTISSTDAYQKTNSAFKSLGSFASRKLGDLRNSGLYKSVEEKVGDAYTSVKSTLSTSRSASNVNVMPGSPIDSLLEDDEVYNSSSRQPVATDQK